MFSKLRSKLLVLLAATLFAVLLPVSFMAANADVAAFTQFEISSTTVEPGQPVTISVATVGATYVFAESAGIRIPATMLTGENVAPRRATWTLTVTPSTTQILTLFASVDQTGTNAASIAVPITVNVAPAVAPAVPPPLPEVPAPAPTPPPVVQTGNVIHSVTETTSSAPGRVTLTVVTNAEPGFVWINVADRFTQGVIVSQNANEITWEIDYLPPSFVPHQAIVYANSEYLLDGFEASQNVAVNLTAVYVPTAVPQILRTTLSQSSIDDGGQITITVRTNADVGFVWAMVDGNRVNLSRNTGVVTGQQITWSVAARPIRTQDIEIFANTENTDSGAVTGSARINVRERGWTERPGDWILTATLTGNNFLQIGETTEISLRTTTNISRVWAMVDGTRVEGRRMGSSETDIRWVIYGIAPQRTQSVEVFAGRNLDDRDPATTTVNIMVIGTEPL
ncbi:MAG: hypothetical protein FWG68_05430 [Defluviitaleaceae bacterium]|nr:hypothetical protein [Defluviitaleaceae bacterium]